MRRCEAIIAAGSERDSVSPDDQYTPTAQGLHWVTALLMLVAVVVAWTFMATPNTGGDRFTYITLHKSVDQTIFILAVIRLIWRKRHPPPLMAGRLARWEARAARWNHWLLYGILADLGSEVQLPR